MREIRRLIAELADTQGQSADLLAALDFLEVAVQTLHPLTIRVPFAGRPGLVRRIARAKAVLQSLPPSDGALRFAVERRLVALGPHYHSLPENRRGPFAECVAIIIQAETGAQRRPSAHATRGALEHACIPPDVKPTEPNPLKTARLRTLNRLLKEVGLEATTEKSLGMMLEKYSEIADR